MLSTSARETPEGSRIGVAISLDRSEYLIIDLPLDLLVAMLFSGQSLLDGYRNLHISS